MRGVRSILTGFAVGMVIGASGYLAAAEETPLTAASAPASSVAEAASETNSRIIGNESGGYLMLHAMQVLEWQKQGTAIRFTGQCDSACTLYLALPDEQICISQGASFRFHAPTANSDHVARLALEYLLQSYPRWVNSWIAQMGGLSDELITMDYDYARHFIRSCDPGAHHIVHVSSEGKPSS